MRIHSTVSAAPYLQIVILNRKNYVTLKKYHITYDENILLLPFTTTIKPQALVRWKCF